MIQSVSYPPTVGLMFSGGLDSAALLAKLLQEGYRAQPIYVRTGCCWEREEYAAAERLLDSLDNESVLPLVELAMPVEDLYARHWSMTGDRVPDGQTSDEAVMLPARNPLLLLKPLVWCGQQGITSLALGTLAANPFADATREFFQAFQSSLATATGKQVEIICPFADATKKDILAITNDIPLQLTFSCLSPSNGLHCGNCNKCAERTGALRAASLPDLTEYARDASLSI